MQPSNFQPPPKAARRAEVRNVEEKGIALIITALSTVFLALFAGLATDASLLMVIRGRMSAAVDSAALGAGRELNLGSTAAEADAFATTAGQSFFLANFPQNYLGTLPINPPTDIVSTFTQQIDSQSGKPNGVVNISVTATVTAPVYFMRLANFTSVPITTTGTASRRGLAMMLVLDISSSMNNFYSGSTACTTMVAAASSFVQNFSPYDAIGMIAFEGTAHLEYAPSTNWKSGNVLVNAINALVCTSSTNTTAALNLAYTELKSVNEPIALNTIVLFTDGMPNSISAAFPFRNQVDTRYGFSGGPAGCTNTNALCTMPRCTTLTGTVVGAYSQGSGYNPTGNTNGLAKDFDTDPNPSGFPAGCPNSGSGLRQTFAGIPALDRWGNATSGFKDPWVFPVNWNCNPAGTCANLGANFSPSYTGVATGSNLIKVGPYTGLHRMDQPTTIGAVGMNTATAEANVIRSDTTFNPVIHSIFLCGNGADPVDKYFLPIISNLQEIPALPLYEPTGTGPIVNPYYNKNQQTGLFFAASDKSQLAGLFAQIASSLLRLSQ